VSGNLAEAGGEPRQVLGLRAHRPAHRRDDRRAQQQRSCACGAERALAASMVNLLR